MGHYYFVHYLVHDIIFSIYTAMDKNIEDHKILFKIPNEVQIMSL